HAIGASTAWEAPHSTRHSDTSVEVIRPIRVRIVSPGISPPICTACRLLPFCLARQDDPPPFLAQQAGERFWCFWPLPQARCEPVAIGHCLVPGHICYRVILRLALAVLASSERTKVLLPAPGSPSSTRRRVLLAASRALSGRVSPSRPGSPRRVSRCC